jgi:hypothetical protein
VRSIPRDGQPKGTDEPETSWSRQPGGGKVPGDIPDSDEPPFNRPAALNSIPREKQPDDSPDTPMDWKRSPQIPGDT